MGPVRIGEWCRCPMARGVFGWPRPDERGGGERTVGLVSRVVPLLDACTGALREDVRPR